MQSRFRSLNGRTTMSIVLTSKYVCLACYYLKCIMLFFFKNYDQSKPGIEYLMTEVFDERFW